MKEVGWGCNGQIGPVCAIICRQHVVLVSPKERHTQQRRWASMKESIKSHRRIHARRFLFFSLSAPILLFFPRPRPRPRPLLLPRPLLPTLLPTLSSSSCYSSSSFLESISRGPFELGNEPAWSIPSCITPCGPYSPHNLKGTSSSSGIARWDDGWCEYIGMSTFDVSFVDLEQAWSEAVSLSFAGTRRRHSFSLVCFFRFIH